MQVKGYNLSMIRGDSASISVSCVDALGQAVTLAAPDSVKFTLKKTVYDAQHLLQKTITVFTDGKAIINLTPTDTSTLVFGSYVYDVELTRSGGVVSTIIPPSKIEILGEVTW